MSDLPPAPDGALIYTHPQGKTIYVLPDGNMVCYKPDGKRGTSSATPAKLAAGHGGWELVAGSQSDEASLSFSPDAQGMSSFKFDIAPQQAETAETMALSTFVTNDQWVLEQKLDGHRVLLCANPDGTPYPLTRNGAPYTKGLPTALRNFRFPAGDWVLDGELVGSTYWVFDMPQHPHLEGFDLMSRRVLLEDFVANYGGPIRIVPQARTLDEKHALARTAIVENFEGLMAKRRLSMYTSGGRNRDWMKVKFTKTVDCVVIPKKKPDGHNSVALGVYKNGRLVEIGHSSLNGKEKRIAIVDDDVLEVRYLYVGANGRLFQPTILRKRPDKRPDECTGDQLVMVNKAVLEAIV